ncbi:MAG: hypothetical protein ACREJG_09215 [Candidatus Rokuibacteriota bacterium]
MTAVLAPLGGILLLGVAAAGDLDVERQAGGPRDGGPGGMVTGRVFEEPRTPQGEDVPLDGTQIILVPRSDALVEALEAVKRRSRDSQQRYLTAVSDLRSAQDAYERRLIDAGAGDLIRTTAVTADGSFAILDVPPGEWLLIARRALFVKKTADRGAQGDRRRGRQLFLPRPPLTGFYTVSTWLRRVSIAAGRSEHVELTDRGVWFTGVHEQRRD